MISLREFWIRKDRDQYFLCGVLLTCVIGGFVSSYWHFSDRLKVKPVLKLPQRMISKEQESQKLKEAQFYVPKFQVGATQYYKLEEKSTLPRIPDLPEVDDEN